MSAPASPAVPTPVARPARRAIDPSAATRRKVITASFVGNFVEWFDYASYGAFAAIIATVFFADDDPRVRLVKTFGLFALSFLVRPIGGLVWGHVGDRVGRRTVLSLSILLMTGATVGIALIPGHATIGVLAPALLLALRVLQGFSASGEYAGASAYLTEYAPPGRRGAYAAVVPTSTASGLLLGSVLAAVLTATLSESALESWGWRVPFLLAAPLGLVGRYIRLRLEDSPEFLAATTRTATTSRAPWREVWREPRALLVTFGAALLNAAGFYVVLSYMPTYLTEELGLGASESFLAATVALVCYIGFVAASGRLSDRVGRKPVLLAAAVIFALVSVPAFMLLDGAGLALVIAVQIVLGAVLALNDGVLPSFLSEQFPTRVRFTGFALTFNVANAVFGGTASMVATLLIGATGDPVAPAFYLVALAVVTGIAVLFARESAHGDLRRDPS